MNTIAKQTIQVPSPEAEQWKAFKCEMAERAEARIAVLNLTDPKQVYLTAREEIYAASRSAGDALESSVTRQRSSKPA